ncbi:hypothetical protein EC968_003712 [Mortierella alpina]|nr:hypothetical protein EC968_003712 [Mortierella alpina]
MYPFSAAATAFLFLVAYLTTCLAARDDISAKSLFPLLRNRNLGTFPQQQPQLVQNDLASYGPFTGSVVPTTASEPVDRTASTRIRVTKTQLETMLGLALDTQFTLEVISDETPNSVKGDQQPTRVVLGRIPVHLRVKELQIGGVSAPHLQTESVNAKLGGVNYGTIRA